MLEDIARKALAPHLPPGFALRTLQQFCSDPASFEWLAERSERRLIGGSVSLQEHGDYSVCILLEHSLEKGWTFPRRWQHGTLE